MRLAGETAHAPPNTVTRDLHRFVDLLMDVRGVLCYSQYGQCVHPWSHMRWNSAPEAMRTEKLREVVRELRAVERVLLSRTKKSHKGRQ